MIKEKKIFVGDKITINKDNLSSFYPFYTEWSKFFNIDARRACCAAPHLDSHVEYDENEPYEVVWIAPHLIPSKDKILYAIKGYKSGYTYIVERPVIDSVIHTKKSYDNTDKVIKILVQELHKAQTDLLETKEKLAEVENKFYNTIQ